MSLIVDNIRSKYTKQQLIFIGVTGVVVIALAIVFFGPGRKGGDPDIPISIWVVEDDSQAWGGTVDRFRDQRYPQLKVSFRTFSEDQYERELIDALAAGKGPDIFMFNNKWLTKHGDKISPIPQQKMSPETFAGLFPQVAEQDFVFNDKIYAMPVSVDTLALIYNRDIFDLRGVVFPPEHWNEFLDLIPQIRTFEDGKITLAAAAIGGTSKNIPHSSDILTLLLLQNDLEIVNERLNRASFSGLSGQEVFEFYTQFGDPDDPLYTWGDKFDNAFDLFANRKVAMVFAYGSDLKEIRARNPFLNYAVRPLPQLEEKSPVNVADYWGLAVSDVARNKNVAWDFAIFATTDRESALDYIDRAGRPPALRFLIDDHIDHPILGIFAAQALTARSWRQPDDKLVTEAFDRAIEAILSGNLNVKQALSEAERTVTDLLRDQ